MWVTNMKKYNKMTVAFILTYLVIAVLLYVAYRNGNAGEDSGYKVEINRMMQEMEAAGAFSEPELRDAEYVKQVYFLPVQAQTDAKVQTETDTKARTETDAGTPNYLETRREGEQTAYDTEAFLAFYKNHNGVSSVVYPFVVEGRLEGVVRFDYLAGRKDSRVMWIAEAALFILFLTMFSVLWYIRVRIIRPFHVISQMPYELAKGNMQVDVEENRERFFGRFVWGISMLRDTLNASKEKTLRLEKEKKLLLLSISHDIKIPLSTIKLYAKALKEGVYETEEQKEHAASRIENHAKEIEEFVQKIVNTASEDILDIEVVNSEFYLREYMEKIREIYAPKCRLRMTEFVIGAYEDKLLKGDMDRAVEVMENLMENAVKYGDGRSIRLNLYEEDYCQVIEVCNTGVPVPQNEIPHLFDSFFRGSNAQDKSGNGLGLYIARQMMLKMEGDIFARRTGEGMCIGLVFGI